MSRNIIDRIAPSFAWLTRLLRRPAAHGRVTPYYLAGQERRFFPEGHNEILYGWGGALANLLANTQDGKFYHIGGMYFEFDNSGAAVNPTPTISRSNTRAYYAGLSGTRDYLRVPITLRTVASEDEADFPDGNVAEFYAETTGVVGLNGLPFSNAAGSRVYVGGAARSGRRNRRYRLQPVLFCRGEPAAKAGQRQSDRLAVARGVSINRL